MSRSPATALAKSATLLGVLLALSVLTGFECHGQGAEAMIEIPLMIIEATAEDDTGKRDRHDTRYKNITVRVWVKDDTIHKPLADDAEIRLANHGTWRIKRAIRGQTASRNLGRHEVWRQRSLYVYPDGRDGSEIEIVINLTPEMKPKGLNQDVIRVVISDDDVVASGSPVEAGTFQSEIRFERFRAEAR